MAERSSPGRSLRNGGSRRSGWPSGGSARTTSAPKSPNNRAAKAPETRRDASTTRSPVYGSAGVASLMSGLRSVEQVGLFAHDAVPQRLEAEPADAVGTHLGLGERGVVGVDQHWLARRLGQQLGLAGTLHGDEPPGGLVHRLAHRQQSVIAKDYCLIAAEGVRDALAFFDVQDDTGVVVKQGVLV